MPPQAPSANPPVEPKLMRIGQAARAAGVPAQTIEYYMLLGLLEPIRQPGRPGRFFDAALIQRVKLIRRLNESGYTLRAILETYLARR
jgi:DNA-binding transcriptional MerR regulator